MLLLHHLVDYWHQVGSVVCLGNGPDDFLELLGASHGMEPDGSLMDEKEGGEVH